MAVQEIGYSAGMPSKLPGLNGLRWWGVFGIFLLHALGISVHRMDFLLPYAQWMQDFGINLVQIFFVISGFLITYLLLRERSRKGRISVRKFYVRRMLRIWPAYFLVLFIGFAVGPVAEPTGGLDFGSMNYIKALLLFIFFMPNVSVANFHVYSYLSPLWSIGVEEQFYLFWPWVVKKSRKPIFIFAAMIVITPVLLAATGYFLENYASFPFLIQHISKSSLYAIDYLLKAASLECFAFGGLFAFMFFYNRTNLLKVIFNRYFQLGGYAVMFALMITRYVVPVVQNELLYFLFAVLVINIGCNPKSIIRLNSKWEDYLGDRTYGMYLYHCVILYFLNDVLVLTGMTGVPYNIAFILIGLVLTLVISTISYNYFESWFLRKKAGFN